MENFQKKILLSAKKSFTQTVIEIRNIALEINLQLNYRAEMLIKLLELSLDNFEYCQQKFKNKFTPDGFGSYIELKKFLDNSLIKFHHEAQMLISNFTRTTTDKCFGYIIPKKKSKKVKKFLREWTKMDLTVAEMLKRLNECDDRIITKTQEVHFEFKKMLEDCNIKPIKINGAFDFLMENLDNLERKNFEYYDPENEEGFEELMLVFQKFFEGRDEILNKGPKDINQKLKNELEYLGNESKKLDEKGEKLREEMRYEIKDNRKVFEQDDKMEEDKIEDENLDFFKKRKKKKNSKKGTKKTKTEDSLKEKEKKIEKVASIQIIEEEFPPKTEVSESVLISINKTHLTKNDPQFSSKSNSLKLKKDSSEDRNNVTFLFDFLTDKDLERAKNEPISFTKFFTMRVLNLNNNIKNANNFSLVSEKKFYAVGERRVYLVDEEKKIAKFILEAEENIEDILVDFRGRIIYTSSSIFLYDNSGVKKLDEFLKCICGKNVKLNKKKSKILFQSNKCEISSISLTTFKNRIENEFVKVLGNLVEFIPFQYITARGEKDNIAILTEKGAIQFQAHFLSIFLGVKMEQEKFSSFSISYDLKYLASCSFIESNSEKEPWFVKVYLFSLSDDKKKFLLCNEMEFEGDFGERIVDVKFQYKTDLSYLISLKFFKSGKLKFLLLRDSKLNTFCKDIRLKVTENCNRVVNINGNMHSFFDNSKKMLKIEPRFEN